MGFRFQRRIKIAPGVRLNFSKSGISTSVGGKGFTLNSRGTATVGIPGTGLSYRHNLNQPQQQQQRKPETNRSSGSGSVAFWIGVVFVAVGGVVPLVAWIGLTCILLSRNK